MQRMRGPDGKRISELCADCYIDGSVGGNETQYINHSCEPNTIVSEGLRLIALRPIASGEELTLDYSTTELDPYWTLACTCGAPRCRRTIRAFPSLPGELQARYGRFMPTTMLTALRKGG